LAGYDAIEVAAGVGWTKGPAGRMSWFGHEGEGLLDGRELALSSRDGVSVLLEETHTEGTEIATIGMQSNVAAALERDPSFGGRVSRLDVMGGVFAPIRFDGGVLPASADHNLMVDPQSSIRSLSAGIPTLYVPLDVTVHTALRRSHLERLRSGDDLCRALAQQIDVWMRVSKPVGDRAAMLHDPLAVACVVDRSFVTCETLPVTVAIHDGAVRTFIDPVTGTPAEVVRSVDGTGFADFWLETVLG
jgi:inosine-uridine nucleoside N-ribohydrolase